MEKTTRLSINVTVAQKMTLESLQVVTGATSDSEVIRRAVGLYSKIMEEQQRGKTLHFRDEVGELEQVHFF